MRPKTGWGIPDAASSDLPETIEALDAYAKKVGITRSEAVRQLIEAGLKGKRQSA